MTALYIYDLSTREHIATINGADNSACETKAAEAFDANSYGWTYSPAFGFGGGLVENLDADEIKA